MRITLMMIPLLMKIMMVALVMTIMRMRMRIVEFLISREGASPAWDQSTGRRQLTVTHPRLALSRIVRKTKIKFPNLFNFLFHFFSY